MSNLAAAVAAMASDNDASCENDPNFAVVCAFLEKFGSQCGLPTVDFLQLQGMLENSDEVPPFLKELILKLLRRVKKSVKNDKWEKTLVTVCHNFSSQDAWEIERFGYKKAKLSSKIRVLKELMEMQFDFHIKFKNEINKLTAQELRSQPLGRDKTGHAYWFQNDENYQIRVYKEDLDEETWTLIAKDRLSLVALIDQLSDRALKSSSDSAANEDSNSMSDRPIIDTGQNDTDDSKKITDEAESSVDGKDNPIITDKLKKDDKNVDLDESNKTEELEFEESVEEEEEDVDEEEESEEEPETPVKTKQIEVSATFTGKKRLRSLHDDPTINKVPRLEEKSPIVSDEIKEPVLKVQGEGSGDDNNCENHLQADSESPIVGETITEEVVYFSGEGLGLECETGNEDKASTSSGGKNNETEKDPNSSKNDSIKENASVFEDNNQPKRKNFTRYKLGTVIDTKTDCYPRTITSPLKKSRWDVETSPNVVSNNLSVSTVSTGKVKNLVSKFEQVGQTSQKVLEEIETPPSTPKKPMFFFGPTAFRSPSMSPSFTIGFGQKSPVDNEVLPLKIEENPVKLPDKEEIVEKVENRFKNENEVPCLPADFKSESIEYPVKDSGKIKGIDECVTSVVQSQKSLEENFILSAKNDVEDDKINENIKDNVNKDRSSEKSSSQDVKSELNVENISKVQNKTKIVDFKSENKCFLEDLSKTVKVNKADINYCPEDLTKLPDVIKRKNDSLAQNLKSAKEASKNESYLKVAGEVSNSVLLSEDPSETTKDLKRKLPEVLPKESLVSNSSGEVVKSKKNLSFPEDLSTTSIQENLPASLEDPKRVSPKILLEESFLTKTPEKVTESKDELSLEKDLPASLQDQKRVSPNVLLKESFPTKNPEEVTESKDEHSLEKDLPESLKDSKRVLPKILLQESFPTKTPKKVTEMKDELSLEKDLPASLQDQKRVSPKVLLKESFPTKTPEKVTESKDKLSLQEDLPASLEEPERVLPKVLPKESFPTKISEKVTESKDKLSLQGDFPVPLEDPKGVLPKVLPKESFPTKNPEEVAKSKVISSLPEDLSKTADDSNRVSSKVISDELTSSKIFKEPAKWEEKSIHEHSSKNLENSNLVTEFMLKRSKTSIEVSKNKDNSCLYQNLSKHGEDSKRVLPEVLPKDSSLCNTFKEVAKNKGISSFPEDLSTTADDSNRGMSDDLIKESIRTKTCVETAKSEDKSLHDHLSKTFKDSKTVLPEIMPKKSSKSSKAAESETSPSHEDLSKTLEDPNKVLSEVLLKKSYLVKTSKLTDNENISLPEDLSKSSEDPNRILSEVLPKSSRVTENETYFAETSKVPNRAFPGVLTLKESSLSKNSEVTQNFFSKDLSKTSKDLPKTFAKKPTLLRISQDECRAEFLPITSKGAYKTVKGTEIQEVTDLSFTSDSIRESLATNPDVLCKNTDKNLPKDADQSKISKEVFKCEKYSLPDDLSKSKISCESKVSSQSLPQISSKVLPYVLPEKMSEIPSKTLTRAPIENFCEPRDLSKDSIIDSTKVSTSADASAEDLTKVTSNIRPKYSPKPDVVPKIISNESFGVAPKKQQEILPDIEVPETKAVPEDLPKILPEESLDKVSLDVLPQDLSKVLPVTKNIEETQNLVEESVEITKTEIVGKEKEEKNLEFQNQSKTATKPIVKKMEKEKSSKDEIHVVVEEVCVKKSAYVCGELDSETDDKDTEAEEVAVEDLEVSSDPENTDQIEESIEETEESAIPASVKIEAKLKKQKVDSSAVEKETKNIGSEKVEDPDQSVANSNIKNSDEKSSKVSLRSIRTKKPLKNDSDAKESSFEADNVKETKIAKETEVVYVRGRRGRSRKCKDETPVNYFEDSTKKPKLAEEEKANTDVLPKEKQITSIKEGNVEKKGSSLSNESSRIDSPASADSIITLLESADNNSIEVPEKDPLANSEDIEETEGSANAEKPPVLKKMNLQSFSMDFNESNSPPEIPVIPSRRAIRKRGREVSPVMELEAGKRPKIKGRRQIDTKLRKSIEQMKERQGSSSEDAQEVSDDEGKSPRRKMSKTPKGKVSGKQDVGQDEEENKPKKKRRSRILAGLGITDDNPIELTGVRQSRRIAQLKIKEQVEVRKLEKTFDERKKKKGKEDKDFKVQKSKLKKESSPELEIEEDLRKKKKRKDKAPNKIFDETRPWKSSSESSEGDEDVEEEEEAIEEDEPALEFKSDHEFSPESDLEEDGDAQPLRRARTVRKTYGEESDDEAEIDDCPCQKCGKSDHPEWILLCDKCDNGWHCSCLRPPLLVIPEGDWYCPPCQHVQLIKNLEAKLVDYNKKLSKKEVEDRRKERLAYVGISLNNVLPSREQEHRKKKRRRSAEGTESSSEVSESPSAASLESDSDSDEPIYQLRQRRQAKSYKFNEYDDLIKSAIQDELEEKSHEPANPVSRGKDMETIVKAEEMEKKEKDESQTDPKEILQEKVEEPKEEKKVYSDEEVKPAKSRKKLKKRNLNKLDFSSEEDDEKDEDFKGTSSQEDDEDYLEDDDEEESEDDSEDYVRGGKRRKNKGPVRRSGRARTSRFDADFINDKDSDYDDAPKKKKKKKYWSETDSEESEGSWDGGKRRKKRGNASSTKKKSKKKSILDELSDVELKKKKPKIKYGGLTSSEEDIGRGRRTRGKKTTYIDTLGSDSEEDNRTSKNPRRLDSDEDDEDFVANEEEEEDNVSEEVQDEDEESSSDRRPLIVPKIYIKKPLVSKEAAVKDKTIPMENETKKIEPKTPTPETTTNSEKEITLQQPAPEKTEPENYPVQSEQDFEDKAEEATNPIEEINKNLEDMGSEEMEKMMEEEEYANKHLKMVAVQLEKEKKKKAKEESRKKATFPSERLIANLTLPKDTEVRSVIRERLADVGVFMNEDSNDELSEPPAVALPLFEVLAKRNEEEAAPKKRKGRGKGKKTLEETLANLGGKKGEPEAIQSRIVTDPALQAGCANIEIAAPPQPFSQSAPTPSVITRMLQNKLATSGPASVPAFPVGAIRTKHFAVMPADDEDSPNSRSRGSSPSGVMGVHMPAAGFIPGGPRLPVGAPFRPVHPGVGHFPRGPHHLYHPHRPVDPSPSTGGPVNMSDPSSPVSTSTSGKIDSPAGYQRAPAPVRFPPIASTNLPRPMHLMGHVQQRQTVSPHAPYPGATVPPFYAGYVAGEDAMPPTAYQNAPYTEQFSGELGNDPSENSDSKSFGGEESGGEFGGLVSYFSSQREDDLES